MNFFDKPHNLINQADTILGHVCNESVFNRIGNNGYTTHSKHSFKHSEETEKLVNAVLLVEVGYSIPEVAEYLKINPSLLQRWVNHFGIVSKNKLKREAETTDRRGGNGNKETVHRTTLLRDEKKRQEIRELLQLAKEVSQLLEHKAKKEAENSTENDISDN